MVVVNHKEDNEKDNHNIQQTNRQTDNISNTKNNAYVGILFIFIFSIDFNR